MIKGMKSIFTIILNAKANMIRMNTDFFVLIQEEEVHF